MRSLPLIPRLVVLLILGFVVNVVVTAVLSASVNVHAAQRLSAAAPVGEWQWQASATSVFVHNSSAFSGVMAKQRTPPLRLLP